MSDEKSRNEGEGSKSADRQYREAATDFARRTDTVKAGEQAAREVEKDRAGYDQAEKAGRSHGKGELRKDLTGEDFNEK